MTDQTYAAEVAADVAARYGVAVAATAVQIVPVGVSARPLPVWNGKALVYPEEQRTSWRKAQSVRARVEQRSPRVVMRRLQIADLHAQGLHDAAIVAALGLTISMVRYDRYAMHLPAHPDPAVAQTAEQRAGQVRALAAQGYGRDAIAAELGVHSDTVRMILRALQITCARQPRKRKPTVVKVRPVRAPSAADLRRAQLAQAVADLGRPFVHADVVQWQAQFGVSRKALARDFRALQLGGLPAVPPPVRAVRAKPVKIVVPSAAALRRAAMCQAVAALGRPLVYGDVAAFCAQFDVSDRLLWKDFRKCGLVWPSPGYGRAMPRAAVVADRATRDAATAARRARLREIDCPGMTLAALAAALDVSIPTLRRDVAEMGLPSGPERLVALNAAQRAAAAASADQIRAMHDRGMTRAEIAAELGCDANTVTKHLKGFGLRAHRGYVNPWSGLHRGPNPKVAALKRQVADLRRAGKSYDEIIRITGKSKATICAYLREAGLTGQGDVAPLQVAA